MKSLLRLVRLVWTSSSRGAQSSPPSIAILTAWPGRRHAQIGPLLGPGMGEIGMRQRLRLIAEQQYDIAGFGLCLEQLAAQPGTVHRLGVVTALQRVPGAAPTETPLFTQHH